ncbi:hypothetical protein [Ensifer soli]|uniref:hypothetical protein n=1 Tax=Ciceribacter sp. sgz301302 TaxID=3342379 RepID=UPI0035B9CCF8
MKTGELTLRVDVEALLEQFRPEVDEIVEIRLRGKLDEMARRDGRRRSRLEALDKAMRAVAEASADHDAAQYSADETRTLKKLIAAAAGLRRAASEL